MEYLLIGLTGSIGAGKSEVAEIFRDRGIPVISADSVAKELMNSDSEMIAAISDLFGPDAYSDGELNRRFIADQVFNDQELLERLNEVVHPRTIVEQGIRARALVEEGARIVACEAALIFETGGEERFDYIVVVDAPEQIRFERAASRDNTTIEEIARRDGMQIPANQKVERADFVIQNTGDRSQLRKNADLIIDLLEILPPGEHLDVEEFGEDEEVE